MALSTHAREFFLHVADVTAELNNDSELDGVTIVVHGKLLPSTKKRLEKAISKGEVGIEEKTLA